MESLRVQLVDSLDGNSPVRTLSISTPKVRIVVSSQLGCLSGYFIFLYVFGMIPISNMACAGLLDILKHVGDAAKSWQWLPNLFSSGNDAVTESHLVENVNISCSPALGGIAAGDECHAFHIADGSVE